MHSTEDVGWVNRLSFVNHKVKGYMGISTNIAAGLEKDLVNMSMQMTSLANDCRQNLPKENKRST